MSFLCKILELFKNHFFQKKINDDEKRLLLFFWKIHSLLLCHFLQPIKTGCHNVDLKTESCIKYLQSILSICWENGEQDFYNFNFYWPEILLLTPVVKLSWSTYFLLGLRFSVLENNKFVFMGNSYSILLIYDCYMYFLVRP